MRTKRGFDPESGQLLPILEFIPRFVRPEHISDLSNLWHISRTACAGVGGSTRYARLLWTSREFAASHDYVNSTGAYKDLDGMLTFGGR